MAISERKLKIYKGNELVFQSQGRDSEIVKSLSIELLEVITHLNNNKYNLEDLEEIQTQTQKFKSFLMNCETLEERVEA